MARVAARLRTRQAVGGVMLHLAALVTDFRRLVLVKFDLECRLVARLLQRSFTIDVGPRMYAVPYAQKVARLQIARCHCSLG